MRTYTLEEKRRIQRHPLWIKYSGAVPDDLRHLVYPDEAKPKAKKKAAEDVVQPTETADGDSN